MTDWETRGDSIAVETVLREWVRRETRKDEYPDADPTGWSRDRLVGELTGTYEEPVEPLVESEREWLSVRLSGAELGELGTFPESAWDRLSGDGTVSGAVERLGDPSVADDFPGAAEKVAWFAEHVEDRSFGAAVAWQPDDAWPPVLLDGNHRACGAHRAAREGAELTVELHLGRVTPPESRTG